MDLKQGMENTRGKRAEDILTDERLANQIEQTGMPVSEEFVLASEIQTAIQAKKKSFDANQKELLGQKINRSIRNDKRRKLVGTISSAAVLLLLVGITVFFQLNTVSDFRSLAQNNHELPGSNTRLILSGKEEIEINTDDSQIEYAGGGNLIRIDAADKVNQLVSEDEVPINTVIVPYGKRTRITLSDNSTIWLNSGSKLIYPARFNKDKREVYLEGEAIFEVSYDAAHPFYVSTRDLEVKVLGTVFNVSAYADDATTNTILESGSVELSYKGNSLFGRSHEKMVPGMLAVLDPSLGTVRQSRVNTKFYTSWREGYLVFDHESLESIIKKVSRYYNVSVELKDQDLGLETFSGPLDLKKSADQVFRIIAEIIDMNVEIDENKIYLKRNDSSKMPM